jgi:hypothetical protein
VNILRARTLTGHAGYIEGNGAVICGGAVVKLPEKLKVTQLYFG